MLLSIFYHIIQLILIQLKTYESIEYDCDISSSLASNMKQGNWRCAKDVVNNAKVDKALELKQIFDIEERTIMKEIASLKQLIDTYQPANYINPAFQWAQSPNEILLNIKFAHKLDAPATLNVEANNVNISNNSLLLLASNGRKNFKLELNFLKGIIPSESTYAMASVGRMTITLKKEHSIRWSRLTEGTQKLKHMHVWWDVVERYKKEVDALPDVYTPPAPAPPVEDTTETNSPKTETETNSAKTETPNNDSNDSSTSNDSEKKVPAPAEAPKVPAKSQEEVVNEKYEAAIVKLDQELKSLTKELEDEIKRRKKELDLQNRKEKQLLTEELSRRKKELVDSIHNQKQNINTDVNTEVKNENNIATATMSVSSTSSEL